MTLNKLAPKVYGEGWQSHMARHLGLWVSTVNRWATGDVGPDVSKHFGTAIKLLQAYIALGWQYDPDTNTVGPRKE